MSTLSQKSSQSGTNDIFIGKDGVLALSYGRESYAEIISDRIRTLKGELPLDRDVGIDYFGTIFKSISRTNIWKHYVKTAIESLPFVSGIMEFNSSYDPSSRVLSFSITVVTDDGVVTVSEQDKMS